MSDPEPEEYISLHSIYCDCERCVAFREVKEFVEQGEPE